MGGRSSPRAGDGIHLANVSQNHLVSSLIRPLRLPLLVEEDERGRPVNHPFPPAAPGAVSLGDAAPRVSRTCLAKSPRSAAAA